MEYSSEESLLHRTCVVCNKKNLLGNVVFYQLSCGHFVHLSCWTGHGGECPLCRIFVFKKGKFGLMKVSRKEKESKQKKRLCCFCIKNKK